jgi:hypothetical protein
MYVHVFLQYFLLHICLSVFTFDTMNYYLNDRWLVITLTLLNIYKFSAQNKTRSLQILYQIIPTHMSFLFKFSTIVHFYGFCVKYEKQDQQGKAAFNERNPQLVNHFNCISIRIVCTVHDRFANF